MFVVGDTRPEIVRLLRRHGQPITNLASASSIEWRAEAPSGAVVTKACTVTDATTGKVTAAALDQTDLDEVGWWAEEVVIIWSAGNEEHPSQPRRFYVRGEYEAGLD